MSNPGTKGTPTLTGPVIPPNPPAWTPPPANPPPGIPPPPKPPPAPPPPIAPPGNALAVATPANTKAIASPIRFKLGGNIKTPLLLGYQPPVIGLSGSATQ